MKKLVSIILTAALLCTMCACGGKKDDAGSNGSNAATSAYATAEEAFTAVTDNWTKDEDHLFPWVGGDMSADEMIDHPGTIDVTKNYSENVLSYWFYLTEAQVSNIKDAASLVHMMNLNTFSAACIKLADGTDTKAFAESYGAALNDVAWMCGFPEKRVVLEADGYVFIGFGAADLIQDLEDAINATFSDAKLLFTETVDLGW